MVVLPLPGGPHRIIEASRSWITMRPIGPSSPRRWSWPRTSERDAGLSLSANGRGAASSNNPLELRRPANASTVDLDRQDLVATADGKAPGLDWPFQYPHQNTDPLDLLIVDLEDDVAGPQPDPLRRSAAA